MKGMNRKKGEKKKATLTFDEKRAVKRAKKEGMSSALIRPASPVAR